VVLYTGVVLYEELLKAGVIVVLCVGVVVLKEEIEKPGLLKTSCLWL